MPFDPKLKELYDIGNTVRCATMNMNSYWAAMDDYGLEIEILPAFDLLPSYTDDTGKKVVTGTVKEALEASMTEFKDYIEYKLTKYVNQLIFIRDKNSKTMKLYGKINDVWGYLHDSTIKYATKYPSRIELTHHSDDESEEEEEEEDIPTMPNA